MPFDETVRAQLRVLARKDLERYREARKTEAQSHNRLEEFRARTRRMTQELNPNKVQVQRDNNGPEELLAEIADMSRTIQETRRKALRTCIDILSRIEELNSDRSKRVLTAIYIDGKQIDWIALDEFVHPRTIDNWHAVALEQYAKKFAPDCARDHDIMD